MKLFTLQHEPFESVCDDFFIQLAHVGCKTHGTVRYRLALVLVGFWERANDTVLPLLGDEPLPPRLLEKTSHPMHESITAPLHERVWEFMWTI